MKYFEVEDTKIICQLCQHHCKLKEDKTGICGIEKNIDGHLVNLTYGKPSALAIDPIEKKPLNHFLPSSPILSLGTVGCNFHCPFCQNYEISQTRTVESTRYISPHQIVQMAIENGAPSIAYTYNEPTVFYPYAYDIGQIAKENALKNVFVSSGYQSENMIEDMRSWVNAINIDLKSFNPEYYKKSLKTKLEGVLDTLRHLAKTEIWLEVTTLVIEGSNDSDEELTKIAEFIAGELGVHIPWHISAFHPDYKMLDTQYTSEKTLKRAYNIGKRAGLKFVYEGNINVPNQTLCPQCNTLLIERKRFVTTQNNLTTGGHCPTCKRKLEGVFK